MSHHLTQPEEIDHILKAVASRDTEADTSVAQSKGASPVARRDEFAAAADFPVVHKKSAQCSADPIPYVWSM